MVSIFSKKMKYILLLSTLVFCVLSFSHVNAEETIENIDHNLEIKEYVEEYIKEIDNELNKIDELIKNMKSQKEYIKYPAVRLNVQTPFLGISAITENRLNITQDVSVIDRTKKYSIRDVVNKKIIKIPSFTIGSITILTEEVNINDEKLTNEDLNLILYYLRAYLEQTKEVYKFVEQQKNNIFLDYIPKENKEKVTKLNEKNTNIIKELDNLNNKIVFLKFSIDKEEYLEIENEYTSIYNKFNEITDKLSDILISSEELINVEKEISLLESRKNNLISNINLKYDIETLNLDKVQFISNMYNELINSSEFITSYINDSFVKKELEEDGNTYEQIVLYEVKNQEVLESLEAFVTKLQSNLPNTNETENTEESENSEEIHNIKVYTNEQDFELVKGYCNEYLELINKIRAFYYENNNYLLNEQKFKLEALIKYTDVSVIDYMKQVYFDISKLVEKENINYGCIINVNKSINTLSENLQELLTINNEVYEIYNEKVTSGQIES